MFFAVAIQLNPAEILKALVQRMDSRSLFPFLKYGKSGPYLLLTLDMWPAYFHLYMAMV